MSAVNEAQRLGREAVWSPRRLVERAERAPERAVQAGACVLLAYMASTAVFYWLKPESFPPPPEGWTPPAVPRGLLFWVRVQLWTPALAAVLVATTAWFAQVLRGGRLPLRMAGAGLSGAVPALLLLLHSNHVIPTWAFGLAWVGVAGLMTPAWRRLEGRAWMSLAAVLLALNALAVALVPLFTLAVLLRSAALYHGLEMGLLFWTLGVGSYAVGKVLGLPAARAFAAVFLGLLAQILFVFSMHNAGLLPNDVLKALMAV